MSNYSVMEGLDVLCLLLLCPMGFQGATAGDDLLFV